MFITFEGIEGSGKTTQIRYVHEFLLEKGYDCVLTREPGSTDIGKQIRAILLDPENKSLDPMAELLLYMADRVQHVRMVVMPALSAGKTVLCDRYADATVVYQGYTRGLDIQLIHTLHEQFLDNLKPDITFLLDLPVETGLARAWKEIQNGTRSQQETRFEKERAAFHEKVRNAYLTFARLEPERFRVIDASLDKMQVKEKIIGDLVGYHGSA